MNPSTQEMIKVMVVAPSLFAWGLERLLESQPTRFIKVGVAGTVASCMTMLTQARPDVLLVDLDDDGNALESLHGQTPARIVVMTGSHDNSVLDRAVLTGAHGVVQKCEPPLVLLQAIEKVYAGQVWVDREATGRIFMELARQQAQLRQRGEYQQRLDSLTRRELQTVKELLRQPAAPAKRVAAQLHITEHTLRNHLTAIYAKLGVSSRTELHAWGMQHGVDRQT